MSATNHPLDDLLKTLQTTLNVASVTDLAVGGVHNDYPESPAYPWVHLSVRGKPIGPLAGHFIWECEVEIHVHDSYRGDTRALQIADAIAALLHHQAPAVEGWTMILASLEDLYPLPPTEIAGEAVTEWVLPFRVLMEQAG